MIPCPLEHSEAKWPLSIGMHLIELHSLILCLADIIRYGLMREMSDGTVRPVTDSELNTARECPRSPSTAAMSPAHSTRSRQKVTAFFQFLAALPQL